MNDIGVPFYRQTLDFTCGAACIIMTLSHFDRGFTLDSTSEIDVWREGTSVIVMGMGRYGLSFPLLKRGFAVEILTNSDGIDFIQRIEKRLDAQRLEIFKRLYAERRQRAIGMGVKERKVKQITMGDVRSTLSRGGVPIVLTDAKELGDEEAPHWIVLTGADDESFTVNNPLDTKGGSLFPASEFSRIAGFGGEHTLVSVFRQNGFARSV